MRKSMSATALTTFLQCPMRWWHRYVLAYREDSPFKAGTASVALIAGTGFHAAIEYAINACLRGDPVTVEEAVAHGLAVAAEEYVLRPVIDTSGLGDLSPESELDALLMRIKRAATWYLDTQFDRLRPAHAERKFSIELPDTGGWVLTGKIDCLEEDGTVRDFKLSGSKAPPAMDIAARSEQLSVYALATYLETGTPPPAVELDFCRDGLSRMSCIVREGYRSEADCKRTLTRVQRVIECIETGVYAPASHEGIECNGRRCDYFSICPYGGK